MGNSKADSVVASGAEFVTAVDPSCLMHLQGILDKRQATARTISLASILASQSLAGGPAPVPAREKP